MTWIGRFIAEKRPDVIIHLGDHADMPSLSSYAVGKADAEGTRYAADIKSASDAMDMLVSPFRSIRGYKPRMVFTLGNHEYRITREAECNPRMIGTISVNDLKYKEHGWTVHDFLKPVLIDGIEYCHYFTSGEMGRPVASAASLLRERHRSAVMGHVQRQDIAIHRTTQSMAMFAGTCYLHDEKYLGFQGNNCKRGIWVFHEVRNGVADPMFVSLRFLRANYS